MASKMHNFYPTSTGDALCPLGFHPQVRWPTRCKRCFRDYKDHAGKKSSTKDVTSSSPSLSPWEPNLDKATENSESKRNWSSTSNLLKDEAIKTTSNAAGWNSVMDLTSAETASNSAIAPGKSKVYTGSQSDNFNLRRHSDGGSYAEPPQKLQIKNVISKTNGASSNTDAEFIIQVRKSRVFEPERDESFTIKEGTLTRDKEKGEKTEKNEMEKLKAQLKEMKIRCERAEREKNEILLRRLASMDTVSTKTTINEVMKLQKSVKELQQENKGLTEEKSNLLIEMKNVEKELNTRKNRGDREKASEELRAKLAAAETLCESLMDENEDMKKEIRELEEEMYEMQDNFREEQVDEYTNIRKNLEQSNKNCRILSFKLRKIERKSELLEKEKNEFEKRYEQVKKIEEVLKKIGNEYKNKSSKTILDNANKAEIKKIIVELEKEIGETMEIFMNIVNEKKENSSDSEKQKKLEKLTEENATLQTKLENLAKELALEKILKKDKQNVSSSDSKNDEVQTVKKKLEEIMASQDSDRKTWFFEKLRFMDEEKSLKTKLSLVTEEKEKFREDYSELKKQFDSSSNLKNENSKMETTVNKLKKELALEKEKLEKLKGDLALHTEKETRITKTITSLEKSKSQLETELKALKKELENTKNSSVSQVEELQTKFTELEKTKETLESHMEKEKQNNELEIASLKKKNVVLQKSSINAKKINELKQNYDDKIRSLEGELEKSVQQHFDLNSKYEQLLYLKTKFENEKENLESQILEEKRIRESISADLEIAVEKSKIKEKEWSTQKSSFEEQIRNLKRNSLVKDLSEENNRLKKERESMTAQLEDVKKINENLSEKLNDFNAVTKAQRNFTVDTAAFDSEIRKLKNALSNAEKVKKADLAQCKMQYEHRILAINDEIQYIKTQLTRYKKERDMYKHMLEAAQKNIVQLKASRQRKHSGTSIGKSDEDEEVQPTNITDLEKQMWMMEDELSDAKLEASKLKTELASERSASQIKFAELQSRINELEEERLLASGRTKMPGLKVRMELAWQKEREEQQKLLQETATLARDLRQTLLEMDRERDKERLENKRKQDQLKKLYDEEKEENKKKLMELQCDLLELRDAHAKLRTSNEKMRREKERQERDREEWKNTMNNRRRYDQVEIRNINVLLKQVDDLLKLFPEINKKPETYTPTPPRRSKGSKSRESSPKIESKNGNGDNESHKNKGGNLEVILTKMCTAAKELQEFGKFDDETYSNRMKKYNKRSSSVENETEKRNFSNRLKPTLKRKSISLEQTLSKNEQPIWGTDSNVSSVQSLDAHENDPRYFSLQRDTSVDSRLSGGSTKSEILHRDKRYGDSILRKFTTRLTKSSSMDESKNSYDFSLQTSGSETSVHEEKRDKKNLKKKLSSMFKKGSKSNGLDKRSESRPVSRNSNL